MTVASLIELSVVGAVTGLVGGLLGIGGSLVMIPALTEFLGPNQHLYQASAMIVNFFVVAPAVVQHRRAGALEPALIQRLLPLAGAGVLAGVLASESVLFTGTRETYLRLLFGLFLFAVVAAELFRWVWPQAGAAARDAALTRSAGDRESTITFRDCLWVAVPTGFIAGLLGVGGGVLAVPLQRRFLGIPLRVAIANSAAIIVVTSAVGATLKNVAYVTGESGSKQSLTLAALVVPTAIVGSWFGSRFTHVWSLKWLKITFGLALIVAAIRMTLGAVEGIAAILHRPKDAAAEWRFDPPQPFQPPAPIGLRAGRFQYERALGAAPKWDC